MGTRKAFTVVELVITLAILGIVAAIAIPAFQRYAINGNLKAAARDITSDVALLTERAVAENRMYRITLDVGSNSYTLRQCNALGSPCPSWAPMQVKNFMGSESDISFDPGATPVTDYFFQARGTVTNGSLVLRNSRGSTATITINVTGRQNVQFNLQ
jgi:prepilin-type N-terminal cleavage/methylation domain-containing protein